MSILSIYYVTHTKPKAVTDRHMYALHDMSIYYMVNVSTAKYEKLTISMHYTRIRCSTRYFCDLLDN